ncbi:MAG: glycosyltransferase family 4 protein [Saprospiraceae bacterium]|nr:glycosyltransferase family 4 protein [Saprospiraceae bacterium]
MKVLFVCSGNSKFYDVAPFIRSQGDSLEKEGVEVAYFSVLGRGALNYLKNVSRLRKFIKENDFDVIHAHYSFCGWVAVLAFSGLPLILSLMGDDAVGTPDADGRLTFKSRVLMALSYAVQPFVTAIISKSPNIEETVYRKKVSYLIPNGVRLDQFAFNPEGYRAELKMKDDTQYVAFMGNPTDPNKNIALVQEALKYVKRKNVELVAPYPVSHDTVVKYLNSADVFTLCSFSEGSPNIVKEAMSCNRPMVVTPAGDAAWIVEETEGCFVGQYDPKDFGEKLNQALDYAAAHKLTAGRERVLELELDAVSVARKIIDLYYKVSGKEKFSASIN